MNKPFSKTFRLTKGNHAPARVIDSIKSDINKHVKRERAKELPEGVDFWDFKCSVGPDEKQASDVHLTAIGQAVDKAAAASTTESIFVEIKTSGKRRKPSKPKPAKKPDALDFLPPARDSKGSKPKPAKKPDALDFLPPAKDSKESK